MAFDSQSTKPPVVDGGAPVPFGFIARYRSPSTPPYGAAPVDTWPCGPIVPLVSVSSNSTSASTQAQSTRCVQIEVGPSPDSDHGQCLTDSVPVAHRPTRWPNQLRCGPQQRHFGSSESEPCR